VAEEYIRLENVGVCFRLYEKHAQTLKETLLGWVSGGKSEENSKEFWALRDISLTFSEGEHVGIVGDNGAGKSTLLRAISGIYPPATGEVKTRGFLVPLLEIGLGFNDELTGRENVMLSGRFLGISTGALKNKMDDIFSFSGLEEFIDVPIKYYSSGMQGRLAFALATEVEPDVLLADEIFSSGDIHFQKKSVERMKEIYFQSKVTVLVSHNMRRLENVCNRVIWLENGRVKMDGSPEEVTAEYANREPARIQRGLHQESKSAGA
jgi:ABC-type polysaccharide/polyol phosphate transport system ATPase subunit